MSGAFDVSKAHSVAIEAMKNQLLIVLIKRLGGKIEIPVAEVDGTGGDLLLMEATEARTFRFEVRKKH